MLYRAAACSSGCASCITLLCLSTTRTTESNRLLCLRRPCAWPYKFPSTEDLWLTEFTAGFRYYLTDYLSRHVEPSAQHRAVPAQHKWVHGCSNTDHLQRRYALSQWCVHRFKKKEAAGSILQQQSHCNYQMQQTLWEGSGHHNLRGLTAWASGGHPCTRTRILYPQLAPLAP